MNVGPALGALFLDRGTRSAHDRFPLLNFADFLIQTLRLVLQLYVETRVTLAGFCMFWNFQQSIFFFFFPTVKQYQATKPNIGLCSLESFNINMGNLKEHFDFVCSASNCVLIETARISGSMMRSVGLKCKQWIEIPKSSSWSKVEQEITSELLF